MGQGTSGIPRGCTLRSRGLLTKDKRFNMFPPTWALPKNPLHNRVPPGEGLKSLFSGEGTAQGQFTVRKEVLFSRSLIEQRVRELGARISNDYEGREPIVVGILNGAVFFLADLVRAIRVPTRIDFVRAASYGSGMSSSGTVKLTKDVELSVEKQPVILVEDIVDTGLTLQRIIELMERKGPESIRVCALIDKTERREVPIRPDYCGFSIESGFVVGYGLDFNEQYRHLPDIYTLKEIDTVHSTRGKPRV